MDFATPALEQMNTAIRATTDQFSQRLAIHKRVPNVPYSSLPLASMRQLLLAYQAARRGRTLPAFQDLDVELIERLSPDLMLLDVTSSPRDFFYRHHGSEIALHFGRDMTGRKISDLPHASADYYFELLEMVIRDRCPYYCRAEAAAMIVVDYWDRLLLPLGNERGEVKQILMLNIARTWRVAPERYLELAQHLNQLEQGLCVLDKDGHVRHWNRAFIDMFKLDLSQLTNGMAFSAMQGAAGFHIQLPLRPARGDTICRFTAEGQLPRPDRGKLEQRSPDGRIFQLTGVRLSDGGVAVTVIDMTDQRRVESQLREAKATLEDTVRVRTAELSTTVAQVREQAAEQERLRKHLQREKHRLEVMLQSLADAVVSVAADGTVHSLNPPAERLLGVDAAEAKGKSLEDLCSFRHESDQETPVESPVSMCLRNGTEVVGCRETILVNGVGEKRSVHERVSVIMDEQGGEITGAIAIFSDITRERSEEREVAFAATHDALTGLENRASLMKQAHIQWYRLCRHGTHAALLFIDLDFFKPVNDREGHAFGDRFLKEVANAIAERARESDTVARMGGDEFVVLLDDCDQFAARQVADDILIRIQRTRLVGRHGVYAGSASIGVAVMDQPDHSLEEYLRRADVACYQSKDAGRSSVTLWSAQLDAA